VEDLITQVVVGLVTHQVLVGIVVPLEVTEPIAELNMQVVSEVTDQVDL
jgi:hypothetical protein